MKKISEFYSEEKAHAIEKCTECGLCVENCPIVSRTDLNELSPGDVQKELIAFLRDGEKNDTVFTKVFSCMECFRCVDSYCPEGLSPMVLNEIVKQEYRLNNYIDPAFPGHMEPDSVHRVLASIQVSPEDFKRIFTPGANASAKYVFFPGCNVYFQPEKILSALDIMDLINDDYAFVPGLDFCCGNSFFYTGFLDEGENAAEDLLDKITSYSPETVVLWCPTCHCRLEKILARAKEFPFRVISFSQFVAENMDKLHLKKEIPKTVTLHEACKSAYTGVDLTGTRDLLQKLPGVRLVEMTHHGENPACCGSGAIDYFPEASDSMRDSRLEEAAETGADLLVDVCHYCHEVFMAEEAKYDFSVVNYVSLLAEALGIKREDKLKLYRKWGDIEKVLEHAEAFVRTSPYSREMVADVLKKML